MPGSDHWLPDASADRRVAEGRYATTRQGVRALNVRRFLPFHDPHALRLAARHTATGKGAHRPMRLEAVLAAAILAALFLTGCSGSETTTDKTSVTVVYWEENGPPAPSVTWTVRCDPPAGTHPDPAAACDALNAAEMSLFEPAAAGVGCTEIFGGPERVDVKGTLRGKPIEATFTRRNGCEIKRWNGLGGLIPKGT